MALFSSGLCEFPQLCSIFENCERQKLAKNNCSRDLPFKGSFRRHAYTRPGCNQLMIYVLAIHFFIGSLLLPQTFGIQRNNFLLSDTKVNLNVLVFFGQLVMLKINYSNYPGKCGTKPLSGFPFQLFISIIFFVPIKTKMDS